MYITDFSNHKQSYLDLNISIPLKVTDHEAALMLMLQGLDYSKFEKPKKKSGRPPAVDSYTMMLILLYARTQGKYSSRDTEKLCKRDLFLLKVLDGKKAPDHSTIDRFIQQHSDAIDNLFYQQINRLGSLGELTKNIVFQDGTKIESKANRYTFIWKKSIKKNLPKLINHIEEIIHESVNLYPIELENSSPEDALKSIIEYLMGTTDNLKPNKTGRGHRITAEQRIFRDTNIYLKKLEDYKSQLDAMPERNSMSKTDPDATFMRMKEDHMRNGQLKPAYNLQVLVDGGYIVGNYASSDRTDYATMIPAIDHMHERIDWKYKKYCADSGYDCQHNHEALEKRDIESYIKPMKYEHSKKRKVKSDIGLKDNMTYDKDNDCFICSRGKKLVLKHLKVKKDKYGNEQVTHVYRCKRGCKSCLVKSACMKKSKAKYKQVQINHTLAEFQRKSTERISSPLGKEIRVNRSIQAEGAFAQIKNNWSFKRFLRKGIKGIHTDWNLMCMSMNIIHLGYRLARNELGIPFYHTLENSA
ncbi:IS1182 family transposase [Thiospirochaeta perfilievii]|uniref:IS1182 family transposase n=3 Tax=Thiospirochaeta perfilievii TaxID=252967 RepID=A0A5C1QDU8_9SPIO|nr:IS1182 family transposase [Thiospirochaeta perfilievii]QEN04372.1 IS1182 family transposase [Thiospirochaeta perfilievii]QEN04543.1 IS1182 family transposase [Thiospirochaeta perfilievii]